MSQFRMFIGTLNNPTVDPHDYIEAWHSKAGACFVTGQLEKGAEGTPHVQFFVQFKKPKRMGGLKEHCKRAHFQGVKQNNGADEYCNKEDTRLDGPWSYGVRPARLNKAGDKARQNKELITMGAEKALEEGIISVANYPKVKSAIDLYKACTHKPEPTPMDNEWIYGDPGIGKTRSVIDKYPSVYEKDKSKYWNGYTNEEVVLIDDLELDEKFMLGTLKKICQEKSFMAEDKFGQMRPIRPKKIIITSNYHYETIWENELDRKALERRFKVTHLLPQLI